MATILIVDDEKRIRSVYSSILSAEGFEVFEAENAVAANEVLKHRDIDLMLLDINMPAVDGSVFYEVVRAFHNDIKVIVASVYPIDDQSELIDDAVDYYDKSESLHVLVRKVRSALDKKPLKDVLVIDDDDEALFLYKRLLENSGHKPVLAKNAEYALDYLETHADDINLIVLDLDMPGFDGMDFFDAVKRKNNQPKVIVSSAYPLGRQKMSVFDADDYYDKSDSNSVFLEKVSLLLNDICKK